MTRTRLVRLGGYGMAATFGAVGVLFAAIPAKVLAAFNRLAAGLDWPLSATQPHTLYLALALGYMYVVTLLAWQIARHPEERAHAWVLTHAKAASAVVCLALFALQEQYLLYLANFVVDGAIALVVWWLCLKRTPVAPAGSMSSGVSAPSRAAPPVHDNARGW
jgi:hypothetical protein